MGSGGVSKKGEVDFFRGGGGAAEEKKKKLKIQNMSGEVKLLQC